MPDAMKRDLKPSEDEVRWTAVQTRDADADGTFFYSVRSTGVFCRPSCGPRLPRRENVSFHLRAEDAVADGFRACRRCRPTSPTRAQEQATVVATLCRAIEAEDQAPILAALAALAGWSPSHTQRTFKATTGVTPKQYFDARQAERVRHELDREQSVTAAMYEAGFQSSGRFYAKADSILGMTPSQFRRGAPDRSIQFATAECTLGWVLVAATSSGICSILLGEDPAELLRDVKRRFSRASFDAADPEFDRTVSLVVALIDGDSRGGELPLDIVGTAFQKRVWAALGKIPRGQTASYAEIAAAIGSPTSARAVAQACAANPIAVAIPCHRVVRQDGGISGYRWGIERKRALLDREQKS